MMIMSSYNNTTNMYYSLESYNAATFNPEVKEKVAVVFFTLRGTKTYEEKKERVRDIVQDSQFIDIGGLSWAEYADLSYWIETYGKRYGLLREFKNEGIL